MLDKDERTAGVRMMTGRKPPTKYNREERKGPAKGRMKEEGGEKRMWKEEK